MSSNEEAHRRRVGPVRGCLVGVGWAALAWVLILTVLGGVTAWWNARH